MCNPVLAMQGLGALLNLQSAILNNVMDMLSDFGGWRGTFCLNSFHLHSGLLITRTEGLNFVFY